jgi:hypothetical protein
MAIWMRSPRNIVDSGITMGPLWLPVCSTERVIRRVMRSRRPESFGSSGRSFFLDETGVIRAAASRLRGDKVDPSLDYPSERTSSRQGSYDSDDRAFR